MVPKTQRLKIKLTICNYLQIKSFLTNSSQQFSPKKNKSKLTESIEDRSRTATSTTREAPPVSGVPGMPSNLHINMDTLFSLHDKLLDMSEMINDMYALQIVAFITVSFVIILFGFFFETKVIIL